MKQRPKRTPPNRRRFTNRDAFLMDDMCNGPQETLCFLNTFDSNAEGNNPQEAEQEIT